jgi:hypothetical protein
MRALGVESPFSSPDGDVGGNILVRCGGAVYVAGEVGGDATINGALMIAGGVGGEFVVRPGGEFTNRGIGAG